MHLESNHLDFSENKYNAIKSVDTRYELKPAQRYKSVPNSMKINTNFSRQNKSYANEVEFTKRPTALEMVNETESEKKPKPEPVMAVIKDTNNVNSYLNIIL